MPTLRSPVAEVRTSTIFSPLTSTLIGWLRSGGGGPALGPELPFHALNSLVSRFIVRSTPRIIGEGCAAKPFADLFVR